MNDERRTIVRAALLAFAAMTVLPRVHAAPPPGHFTVHDDGSVSDNVTGLVWQRDVSTNTFDWDGARTYCEGLNEPEEAGWRLPTILELQSLVDETRSSPAIDLAAFPGTPSAFFWSATPSAGDANRAWSVLFSDGSANHQVVATGTIRARCVR